MKRLVLLGFVLFALVAARAATGPFDFEVLQFRAKELAAQPYKEPKHHIPGWLMKYDYDQYRDIRFDPMRAWWRDAKLPFQLQFFHPGWLYNKPVQIHELTDKGEQLIEFSPRLFDYGHNRLDGHVPADMGFAGFRIHYALNRPDYFDELAVFQGASYFRALGAGMHYGMSARGLALNTAEPGGEEFPSFDEFWVERPAPGARQLVVYALLNSPSVAGAYRFTIVPGAATVIAVKAAVYCRKNPAVFGLAPLTSMFAHGENSGWSQNDYRPEVHDSDGLLMETGAGEWIWRPLVNPKSVRISSFMDNGPHGFGLLQRDRDFKHYDDLEAWYHARPSVWVEPVGNWGAGSVRLVELPTADETNDNIVAFWVPAHLPPPGEPVVCEYKLHWMMDPGDRPPAGFVSSTRTGSVLKHPEQRRFVVEFDSKYLDHEPADPEVKGVVTIVSGATLVGEPVVQKNNFTGAWRLAFEVVPQGKDHPVELRAFLRKGSHVLTETWSYLWNP
ncbi:MAG TPA: glucan biosynthesis protein G [Candidatus Didemnitutus sp.]|nr:glucan biosynthesis protein G [Candidatus Didemnitutus sp.]